MTALVKVMDSLACLLLPLLRPFDELLYAPLFFSSYPSLALFFVCLLLCVVFLPSSLLLFIVISYYPHFVLPFVAALCLFLLFLFFLLLLFCPMISLFFACFRILVLLLLLALLLLLFLLQLLFIPSPQAPFLFCSPRLLNFNFTSLSFMLSSSSESSSSSPSSVSLFFIHFPLLFSSSLWLPLPNWTQIKHEHHSSHPPSPPRCPPSPPPPPSPCADASFLNEQNPQTWTRFKNVGTGKHNIRSLRPEGRNAVPPLIRKGMSIIILPSSLSYTKFWESPLTLLKGSWWSPTAWRSGRWFFFFFRKRFESPI